MRRIGNKGKDNKTEADSSCDFQSDQLTELRTMDRVPSYSKLQRYRRHSDSAAGSKRSNLGYIAALVIICFIILHYNYISRPPYYHKVGPQDGPVETGWIEGARATENTPAAAVPCVKEEPAPPGYWKFQTKLKNFDSLFHCTPDYDEYLDNKFATVLSSSNYKWRSVSKVDFLSEKFNPTIIAMPTEYKYPYFAVGRAITDGTYQEVVGCMMDWRVDPLMGRRKLTCVDTPTVLAIPHTKSFNCSQAWMAMGKGPHDPRIFYSDSGEPLIMYNSNSQYVCFGLYLLDLRVVFPELIDALATDKKAVHAPIKYGDPVELTRAENWHNIEKNWFFFYSKEGAFVNHDLSPRSFGKLLDDKGTVSNNMQDALEQDCLGFLLPGNVTFHQATNSLKVTLCKRGECKPNDKNTIFMHIFHVKSWIGCCMPYYERYVVTFESKPPYAMVSISQPLSYLGMSDLSFTYTVSMAWSQLYEGRDNYYHGFLDDTIILGLGLDDREAFTIDVKAAKLLECHNVCPSFKNRFEPS